jgi:hypothetical protein
MYVLILTLFHPQGPAATRTAIDFSSEKACNDATTKWPMKIYSGSSAMLTAERVPT